MERQIPDISVIVPVYGVELYIERCVRSLMEQTLRNIEFIFVDDCSKDASIEIAKRIVDSYPERSGQVKWLQHEVNKGLPAARNTGLGVARGEYVYHCDSDDYLDSRMLELLLEKGRKDNLDFVWCDFFKDTPSGIVEETSAEFHNDKITMIKKYLTYGWNVVWNTICKKELYDKNNIKSNEELCFCEDYELITRLLYKSRSWGKVDQSLYYYNQTNTNSIVKTSLNRDKLKRTIESELRACQSIMQFFKKNNVYDVYIQELSWRNLKAKRGLLYPEVRRSEYMALWPEANNYIESNPLCSKIDKYCHKWACHKLGWPLIWAVSIMRKLK